MSIHKIHEYKRAKQVVKDLEKVIKIVNATELSLLSYSRYVPVQRILGVINEYKPLLEIHLEQQKIILETKGESKK